MKKLIALILAAILLSVSCIALADEEKPNGFEITFNVEKDFQFNCLESVNAFLATCPLSKLAGSYVLVHKIVSDRTTGEATDASIGFVSLTLNGESVESDGLKYFQIDAGVHKTIDGETSDSYASQWLSNHPGASISGYVYKALAEDHPEFTYAVIFYSQPSL